jgi:hypothetical protein
MAMARIFAFVPMSTTPDAVRNGCVESYNRKPEEKAKEILEKFSAARRVYGGAAKENCRIVAIYGIILPVWRKKPAK